MSVARFWPVSAAGVVLIAAALGIAAVYATDAAGGGSKGNGASLERTERSVAFREDMRKLWEDHIVWTRAFIVSFAADAPDRNEVATRLLANQDDLGGAIKPFYGDAAGQQLSALLKQHILGAVAILQAAKAGDAVAFDNAKTAWYANGNEIAKFLNEANPKNWPLAEISHHMTMHLDLTLQEAANRLGGKFAADIADYDAVHSAILEMSDFLSLGIIHQFPKDFR